jgi:hypothetical protein
VRRTIRIVGWVGLTCAVIALVTSTVIIARVQATHPRDEAAYLHDAHRYTHADGGLKAYDAHVAITYPSDHQLIQAGDRACDWLGHQPPALFITGYHFSPKRLADVYWKATLDSPWAMPRPVYRNAWEDLCPATLFLVKPHFVFSNPPSD